MSGWFFRRPEPVPAVTGWLAINSWRKVFRRRLNLAMLMAMVVLGLLIYSAIVFAVTRGAVAALKGAGLNEEAGIWFALSVFGSVVPVVTGMLALSFRPLFAEPSEAVAAVPVSVKEWYGSQIWRFAGGLTILLVATWIAVTAALAQILELHLSTGIVLGMVAVAANVVGVSALTLVVTLVLVGSKAWMGRISQLVLVGTMAAAIMYVRFQQETGLRHWAEFVAVHPRETGLAAALVGMIAGVAARGVVHNALERKSEMPLGIPGLTRFRSWRQRSLPMPRPLVLQLAVATIRGLVADRKNMAMLVSSLGLFLGFGLASRLAHSPSLNSLVLGTMAVYVPLFLSLIMIFGRSTLGKFDMIYTKPIGAGVVAGGQLLAVAGMSVVVTTAALVGLLLVVGNRIIPGELLSLATNAAVTSGIAWLCGSALRVNPRDNLAILAGVVAMVVVQGGFYGLVSRFGANELLAEVCKLFVVLGIFGTGMLMEVSLSGRGWSRG
jgi:hypothetical protein